MNGLPLKISLTSTTLCTTSTSTRPVLTLMQSANSTTPAQKMASLKAGGGHRVWLNPPYGREIGKWVRKAYEESLKPDTTVVCLLPARTDTKWFHDYVLPAGELEFIRGRLKFGGQKNAAPFPSMVVIFTSK